MDKKAHLLKRWKKKYLNIKDDSLPSIFINTLPKSGSVSLVENLKKGLITDRKYISQHTFPEDTICAGKLFDLAKNGGVCQEHVDASPANLFYLSKILPKFVLHIRHPLQSMISWKFHLDKIFTAGGDESKIGIIRNFPIIPPDHLFFKDDQEQFDWYIENYLPAEVYWINNWLNVLKDDGNGLEIFLSKFEDFVYNERQHIKKILDFFNIREGNYFHYDLKHHFRTGKIDEFYSILTSKQLNNASSKLHGPVLEHYQVKV